ncbi:MAG: hypothetical protein Q8S44_06390 [Flavobacteriaceae bacterium]|nr:hypothetical protein [Flavobacteriaceae bacterium]
MKNAFTILLFFLFGFYTQAQTSTEIFVFDFINVDGKISIANPINISDNEGYDSQPFFLPNSDEILFSSNRNGQTDLIKYNLKTNQKEWLLNTSASEYSPILTPKNEAVSYIKLEENGTQLLWSLDLKTQKESILVPDLKIGYHVWFDTNTLISFVLGEPNTLQVSNLNSKTHKIVSENIGRSLHKIPNQNLVSFVSKKEKIWTINSLNPQNGAIQFIAEIPFQVEDLTWTPTGEILISNQDALFLFDLKTNNWEEATSLKSFQLKGITRLAVCPNGQKIALVVQGK